MHSNLLPRHKFVKCINDGYKHSGQWNLHMSDQSWGGLVGRKVWSLCFSPISIYIALYYYVLSTVLQKNPNTDLLYLIFVNSKVTRIQFAQLLKGFSTICLNSIQFLLNLFNSGFCNFFYDVHLTIISNGCHKLPTLTCVCEV